VALVEQAGGRVALAHPLGPHPKLDLDALLPALLSEGITGIEVYHSEHDPGATVRLKRAATEHNLWWSGGSDFHGPTKPQAVLGGVPVPPEVLQQGPYSDLFAMAT